MRRQWATVLDCIEAGLWGEPERVRAYTELLIERIETDQGTPKEERERDVRRLRQLLAFRASGKRGGLMIVPAVATDNAELGGDGKGDKEHGIGALAMHERREEHMRLRRTIYPDDVTPEYVEQGVMVFTDDADDCFSCAIEDLIAVVERIIQMQQQQPLHQAQQPLGPMKPLATPHHRCHVGEAGVTIYSIDGLDLEEDEHPHDEQLLCLSPKEATQVATYILAHQDASEEREAALNAQFEAVSQELLGAFPGLWKQYHYQRPTYLDVELVIRDAHTRLRNEDGTITRTWYKERCTDYSSHQQHERFFWRYFNRCYRDQLFERYLPEGRMEIR